MTAELRSARPDDAARIVAFWSEAGAEPSVTDNPESVIRLVRHSPDAAIVADEDGRLVATVIATWDGWRGGIYRLAVAPDRRRRGLGTTMLAEAVRRLQAAGAVRLAAIVVADDDRATGFWRAAGWEAQPARARFVLNL
jgi:ribosomal protein S18 acetylase RimI-like enzyme